MKRPVTLTILLLVAAAPLLAQDKTPRLPDLKNSTAEVPWRDFKELLRELRSSQKPPVPIPEPPSAYAVSATRLAGSVSQDGKSLTLALKLDITVLSREKWASIPLLGSDVAVSRAILDGKPAPIYTANGRLNLLLHGAGTYHLTGEFAVRLAKARGTSSASFGYFASPGSLLELSLPGKDLDITASPGVTFDERSEGGKTVASIAIPESSRLTISWRHRREAAEETGEGGRIHATLDTLLTAGEGILSAQTVINYSIYQRKVDAFAVSIPKEMRFLNAVGDGIVGTREETKGDSRLVHVSLGFKAEGNYRLTLSYDMELPGAAATTPIPLVRAVDADRQTGFIAVAAAGSVEVTESGALTNLAALDPGELPPAFRALGGGPILYAYRYIALPYAVTLKVIKHENLAVKRAVIEALRLQSFLVRDGKLLSRARYTIRNNQQQYLALKLPEGAEAWSTYVSGKPVKAAREGDRILVPLPKALGEASEVSEVELVYFQQQAKLGLQGGVDFTPPAMGLECMDLAWDLYLPRGFVYGEPKGTFERRTAASYPPTDAIEDEGKTAWPSLEQSRSNVGLSQGALGSFARNVSAGEAVGVLPVKIDIPLEGIRFSLGRKLVKAEEQPPLRIRYHQKLPGRPGQAIAFVVAFLFGMLLVVSLRRGPDEIGRGLALLLLVGAFVTWLATRAGGPTAVAIGFFLPILVYLGRLKAPAATLPAVLLLAVLMGAGSALADKPEPPDLGDTHMAVPWSDMKGMLETILAAKQGVKEPPPPPVGYAVNSGSLEGSVASSGKSVRFQLLLGIRVLEPKNWVKVPLFGSGMPLTGATLDDKPAPLVTERGSVYLLLHGVADHTFAGSFALPISRSGGRSTFRFQLPPVAVSSLGITVPETGLEFDAGRSVVTSSTETNGSTTARIAVAAGRDFSLSFSKRKEEGPTKVEGKIEAEIHTSALVGEGVVSLQSTINYRLFQKKARSFEVVLPEKTTLLDVSAGGLQGFRDEVADGKRHVHVRLPFEVEKQFTLVVSYELPIDRKKGTGDLPTIEVASVDRQTGFIAVAAKTNVEVGEAGSPSGLLALDPTELPAALRNRIGTAVLYAYRYLAVPYGLRLKVTRHADLPVKRSIIEAASIELFVAKDGKRLASASYRVKNNQQQFLRVKLPAGAVLWGAYVNEKPAKAAAGKAGEVLIPLARSKLGEDNMKPFPVELVYFRQGSAVGLFGRFSLAPPVTDLECLSMTITTHLPAKRNYYRFSGELEPVLNRFTARPKRLLEGFLSQERAPASAPVPPGESSRRAANKKTSMKMRGAAPPAKSPMPADAWKRKEEAAEAEEMPAQQKVLAKDLPRIAPKQQMYYNQAAQLAGSAKGVLPVHIEIPKEGISLTFKKKLIRAGERPNTSFWFLAGKCRKPIRWLIFGASFLLMALVISSVKAASFKAVSRPRGILMAVCVLADLVLVAFAHGSPAAAFQGASIVLALYLVYLVLRRRAEQL